jgi:VWFA-related protein
MRLRTHASLVLIALLLTGTDLYSRAGSDQESASPQSQGPSYQSSTVLRATTRLVVIDVVATDSKGAPVPDLKAEDFTILEDGKPQKISGFTFQRGAPVRLTASSGAGGFSNAPQYKDVSSMNIILLDALNGDFAGHAFGRDELIKFLDQHTLAQPTALFALDQRLTLLHDFTTDNKELKAVLQDFKPIGPVHVDNVYTAASPFAIRKPDTNTTARSMSITIGAFTSLAQALAGYPGRKNLIWVSEGFPITLYPEIIYDDSQAFCRGCASPPPTAAMSQSFTTGAGKDFDDEVERVANALMNAQVAVYPVDASGLKRDIHLNTINTMRSLADRTGGKAFYNGNDIATEIRTSIDDGSTYYTLEYYPESKNWDGKFRVVQLKSRPGVSLRYRQGYYALDPGMQEKDAEKMLARNFTNALSLDAPGATGVVFHAGITPPSPKAPQVTVNFAIDPHTLAFQHRADGMEQATLSCAVAAYSEKGTLVKQEITNLSATMKADDFEKMMKGQQFPCKRTIELKPGSYNLMLGVVDRTSRLMGTTTAWVRVP